MFTSNCYIALYSPPVCLGYMLSRFDRMADSGLVFECTQWWSVTLCASFRILHCYARKKPETGLGRGGCLL